MKGFIADLLGGITKVIVEPVGEIVIKGIIGTVMQLIAPFFVQALLIVACALIPGPVSDQIGGTLAATVGNVRRPRIEPGTFRITSLRVSSCA